MLIIDDFPNLCIWVVFHALETSKQIQHVICNSIIKGNNGSGEQIRHRFRRESTAPVSVPLTLQSLPHKVAHDDWEMICDVFYRNVAQVTCNR